MEAHSGAFRSIPVIIRTDTKLCCPGFVLALFQSTTANKIDSEHTRDYTKVFLVCKVDILQVTINKIELLSSFRLISDDFWGYGHNPPWTKPPLLIFVYVDKIPPINFTTRT